jgi:hypothetical protein
MEFEWNSSGIRVEFEWNFIHPFSHFSEPSHIYIPISHDFSLTTKIDLAQLVEIKLYSLALSGEGGNLEQEKLTLIEFSYCN